ncbi:MAG: ABC transporter ATP-binding protein [Acetobacter sp.]|jgi:sulfonate transport system ATP-binding protein|nr:ABC transporter ATP-binding protein [Acetobacter sp.]MCH4061687.1 ABC transporter ATP-binding protein [Acetobacter sp.]MCH4089464.1 ABC transporter ATP-binding protein [Acetobacter sp.]MCI1293837.1 ABC transporter ATP-binding protein [Acetobacter sp.]MCI1320421.1 ABC transporter ATP-binding protein [Acetobacter sp.]
MNALSRSAPEELSLSRQDNGAVRVRGLTRRFNGGPPILDRLDLTIFPGEFVALLGRSGSGKSTLLRTLSGLDPVSEGQVFCPKGQAVVFQESRLLPWKRVWQNVVLGQDRGKDGRDRAETVLTEVGLSHRIDAWPLTLSGGEAQRAALARALVREPEFLMLDEPFAALDALTRLRMQQLVAALWSKHRCAVLLVTHDVDEALLLADRAVVLEAGRIRTDLSIPLDRPRHHADPHFVHLRSVLLESLGVHDD